MEQRVKATADLSLNGRDVGRLPSTAALDAALAAG
jgi:hypothetical protein